MNSVTPVDLRRSCVVEVPGSVRAAKSVAAPVIRFFVERQEALEHAAWLLGGSASAGMVVEIAQALGRDLGITRRTRSRLRDLLGLLTLEHVHDMDRIEAGLFSQLDPTDPVVEEICLLADGLQSALREMVQIEDALTSYQPPGK